MVTRRAVVRLVLSALGLVLTVAAAAWQVTGFGLGHWLQVHLGVVNEPGPYYGFFSGSGSDLGELADFGAVCTLIIGLWHRHNCHAEGCFRIGLHHVAGQQYVVCRKHHGEVTGHPHRKLTPEFIRERHLEHLGRMRGHDRSS